MKGHLYVEALLAAKDQETREKIKAIELLVIAAVYPCNLNNSHALCTVAYEMNNDGDLLNVRIAEPDTVLHRYSVAGDSVMACVRDTVNTLKNMMWTWL